ncbi:MAG TPA: aldo/keto reductase [Woeseiaceae bacterium]|nr:aldo/keto reductase [Woeseiaceae bacterium]
MTSDSALLTLNNGVQMPTVGLGVFQSLPEETAAAVESALGLGYRLIDTAAAYMNERQVGEGIRRSGIPRDHVFVETKVWISDYGYEATLHGFDKSAGKLGVSRIDLLLLHQALPSRFDLTLGSAIPKSTKPARIAETSTSLTLNSPRTRSPRSMVSIRACAVGPTRKASPSTPTAERFPRRDHERRGKSAAAAQRKRSDHMIRTCTLAIALSGACAAGCAAPEAERTANAASALVIQEQGSFAVGGTVLSTPGTYNNNSPTTEGQTFHGDHLYAFYQIPQSSKALPIVMLHGAYQSARSWETTPDGREGFQTLFLRRGFPVYLVDQPRRGRAGNSTVAATIEPTPFDQLFFDQFRIGKWPNYFDNVQFDRKPETLDQFFRSVTPNTGPYDAGVISDAMSALFAKIGSGILFTHSQGGGPGWLTAIKNPNVKAIVAFEPGSGFIFPEGELPPVMPSAAGPLSAEAVPLSDFQKLTRLPIVIYYGDNFPVEPTTERGQDNWRVRLAMAWLWVDAINKRGGDARLVHLPEIGIRGNTHFLMSDLNNVQIADQVSQFL